MKRLNGIALTEKGVVKTQVREMATNLVVKTMAGVEGLEYFEKEKAWALPIQDKSGNVIYATLTLTVGTKAPNEKAKRKPRTPKEKEVDNVEIVD